MFLIEVEVMRILHELQRYLSIGDAIEIIYMDRSNCFTKRKIKLISIDTNYVHAFCYSRRAPRVFFITNILAVFPLTKLIEASE